MSVGLEERILNLKKSGLQGADKLGGDQWKDVAWCVEQAELLEEVREYCSMVQGYEDPIDVSNKILAIINKTNKESK